MVSVEVRVPAGGARHWHAELKARLRTSGYSVSIVEADARDEWPAMLNAVLDLEARASRRNQGMWRRIPSATDPVPSNPSLIIDLSGAPADRGLVARFDGSTSAASAAATLLRGALPDIEVALHGTVVARARPMSDGRFQTGRGLDDVLARAVTLLLATSTRILRGDPLPPLRAVAPSEPEPGRRGLAATVAFSALPRVVREASRRLRYWPAHWRVGYRFHDGPGVAELGQLAGPDWTVLPDDRRRYYADPFAFEHAGRYYLFVEEYPHATGKGVISVAAFDDQGRPETPRVVLEEPHHLSYPQVFSREGVVYMLPEAGASNALTLYRAERFPDRWIPHAVLIEGPALYDATLLDHDGRLWLLASERDGAGSSSDTMVAFHAERLEGPWVPHRANPILIDRASARSGGAFFRVGRRIVRPVQDGTEGYGGGLGLSDLIRLDEEKVEFSQPVGILGMQSWPHPRIHTLNRAGRLEVIDGLAEVRRVRGAA